MAYFKIAEPGHAVKYIKEIDRANGTLEFSEDRNGCFQQDSGFFADSEFAYLMFHFKEAYPELQYMTIDTSWRQEGTRGAVAIQEEPNDPQPWNLGDVEAVDRVALAGQQVNGYNAVAAVANPVMDAIEANIEADIA